MDAFLPLVRSVSGYEFLCVMRGWLSRLFQLPSRDINYAFDNNTYVDSITERVMEKDELTGFYNSYCDPHSNQFGQNIIFDVHMKAYQPTQWFDQL